MKELTIEEKAKRYDEAIKRVENIKTGKCKTTFMFTAGLLEHIFPELAGNEDERMMNQLHSWMKEFGGAEEYTEKVYQWIKGLLKKQSEHARFIEAIQVGDQMTKNEDGVLVNLSQLNRVAKKDEKKGEQKSVKVPKFKVGDFIQFNGMGHTRYTVKEVCGLSHYINTCNKRMDMSYTDANFELIEQKPAEWSEEDERLLRECIVAVSSSEYHTLDEKDLIENWCNSLKNRIQPQSAKWSEEDKKMLAEIVKDLQVCKSKDISRASKDAYQNEIDWLKSLRPQKQCGYNPYKAVVESITEMCQHYDRMDAGSLQDFYDNVKVKCKEAKEYDTLFPRNHWKPSEEQIKVCKEVYADILSAKGFDLGTVNSELNRLEEELKKLKD